MRTFTLAREIRRDSRDRSRFGRRRRAFHCSSSRVPVPRQLRAGSRGERELWRMSAGENSRRVHGSGAKKEKSRRRRTLVSFLPIVSPGVASPSRARARGRADSHGARDHTPDRMPPLSIVPGCPLVRGCRFSTGDFPEMSTSRNGSACFPSVKRSRACTRLLCAREFR